MTTQDTSTTMQFDPATSFFDLVRTAIKIAAEAEEDPALGTLAKPIVLGNVEFWTENDDVVYLPATAAWDRDALNAALVKVLSDPSSTRESARHVVLFLNDDRQGGLLLDNIQRDVFGKVKSGFVLNGAWTLSIKDGEEFCNASRVAKVTAMTEVALPERFLGTGQYGSSFYQDAIVWAQTQPGAPRADGPPAVGTARDGQPVDATFGDIAIGENFFDAETGDFMLKRSASDAEVEDACRIVDYQPAHAVTRNEETIVRLANGCTLRSGSSLLRAGDYVRFCDEAGETKGRWDWTSWARKPGTAVMQILETAAAGAKNLPLVFENDELVVALADGSSIRAFKNGTYARVCEADGDEVLYYDVAEWASDPKQVMGALLNCAAGSRIENTDSESEISAAPAP